MSSDLPDYTRYIRPPPTEPVVLPPALSNLAVTPIYTRPSLINGTQVKASYALKRDWMKQHCIQHPYVTTASPCGMMVSYEGSYMCLSLMNLDWTGEKALVKACLDEWVKLQKADGSWSQSFMPYLNEAGEHEEWEDLQVDSGAACLSWAMSDYDKRNASVIYKEVVRKAFNFLREAQYVFSSQGYPSLLCNQRLKGDWNYVAFAADCAEVLLATKFVLDAYGGDLTNEAGYSIKTFGNDLYYAIANYCYRGHAYRYFSTVYPYLAMPWGMEGIGLKEKYVFAQAVTPWAIHSWANSAYNTAPDYSYLAEIVIDFINTMGVGRWGGYMYSPFYAAMDENKLEYTIYTAFMAMAMNAVNATKYADKITASRNFINWMALADGRVFDTVDENGILRASSKLAVQPEVVERYYAPPVTEGVGTPTVEAWMFIGHNVAVGLLAGA